MQAKIPATVVTGFLGAGKTTLIRHLLAHAEGARIALIVNEFGDLGVDGEVLKGCGDADCRDEDIIELSNGCICCTVAEDFIPTIKKLLDRDEKPDHIVIETSGLALPQPLVRAFNWPEIRTRVTVDGVVTVVDGPAVAAGRFAHDIAAVDRQRAADDGLDHETPLADLFEDQIACADMIVVNKIDLMEEIAGDELVARLTGEARSGVSVIAARKGDVPPDVLLGLNVGAESDLDARGEVHHHHHDGDDHDHHGDDHAHAHDHAHDHAHAHDHEHGAGGDHHHPHAHAREHGHDAFESFVVESGETEDALALAARIEAVAAAHDVLRVKGFAAVEGKMMRLAIQAVGPRVDTYFDRPIGPEEERGTRLVVIGRAGLDRAAIAAALGAANGAARAA